VPRPAGAERDAIVRRNPHEARLVVRSARKAVARTAAAPAPAPVRPAGWPTMAGPAPARLLALEAVGRAFAHPASIVGAGAAVEGAAVLLKELERAAGGWAVPEAVVVVEAEAEAEVEAEAAAAPAVPAPAVEAEVEAVAPVSPAPAAATPAPQRTWAQIVRGAAPATAAVVEKEEEVEAVVEAVPPRAPTPPAAPAPRVPTPPAAPAPRTWAQVIRGGGARVSTTAAMKVVRRK
jgi:hypothetical protein